MKPDQRISDAKRREIRNAAQQYQSDIEHMWEDVIFELSMKLNLEEETVRKILDEEF